MRDEAQGQDQYSTNHTPRATHHAPRSFKIGIAWQGNAIHKKDKRRRCRCPVSSRWPGWKASPVQPAKGRAATQLAQLAGRFPVTELAAGCRLRDTAAVLKNLDLVIACDTAIVHLAGPLAVPVRANTSKSTTAKLPHRRDSPIGTSLGFSTCV